MEMCGHGTYVLEVTGRSRLLALLVGMLYNDPILARDAWNVEHECRSRKALCAVLREEATRVLTIRIGARSAQAVEVVTQRAQSLQLNCAAASRAASAT